MAAAVAAPAAVATRADAGAGTATAAAAAPVKPIAVDVLDLVKTAQAQNGLRHSDYLRYAAYCTRRLSKIRHAKAVSFTYGSGRKFVARELTVADVTDPRHLQIALYNAERAWAQHKQLKNDVSDGSGNARARHHPVQRLRKAVEWANLLEALATARGDGRTALESQAYAAGMRATLAMELRDWAAGQRDIAVAKKLYEGLAAVSSRRHKELYGERMDELTQFERFCRFNLARGGAAGAAAASTSEATAAAGETAVRLLSGSGGAAGGGTEVSVTWRGLHLPVRADRLRASMTAAEQKAKQLALLVDDGGAAGAAGAGAGAGAESKGDGVATAAAGSAVASSEAIYLELLSRYDECVRMAAGDAARALKEGKTAVAAEWRAIEQFLRFTKLRYVLDRSAVLSREATWLLEAATAAASGAKRTAAEVEASSALAVKLLRGKGKKAARAAALALARSGSGGGEDADAGSGSGVAAAPLISAASPWLSTLASAQAAVPPNPAAGASVTVREGVDPAAVAAANHVVACYTRSLRTLDELIILAGGKPPADASGAAAVAAAAAASGGSAAERDGATDEALAAALLARRQVLAAWRAYYVAASAIAAKRYSDATIMMTRAQTRADDALTAFRTLPAALKPRDLPASALVPAQLVEVEDRVPPAVVLSGISKADVVAMEALLDRVSQQTVTLQAQALMEQLAPRIRADGAYADAYLTTFGPDAPASKALLTSLTAAAAVTTTAAGATAAPDGEAPVKPPPGLIKALHSAPAKLVRNTAVATSLAERTASGTALAFVVDSTSVAPWPPRPLAVPFKPVLLDLASNYLTYPDLSSRVPRSSGGGGAGAGAAAAAPRGAAAASPAPATAGAAAGAAAGGGGLLSWITGGSR